MLVLLALPEQPPKPFPSPSQTTAQAFHGSQTCTSAAILALSAPATGIRIRRLCCCTALHSAASLPVASLLARP
jgi:hypothetical protein